MITRVRKHGRRHFFLAGYKDKAEELPPSSIHSRSFFYCYVLSRRNFFFLYSRNFFLFV